MQTDEHGYRAQRLAAVTGKGEKWEAITPHDTNPIPRQYKDIVCSSAGTCVMKDTAGTALTLTIAANALLPVVPTIIATTSTGTFYGIIE